MLALLAPSLALTPSCGGRSLRPQSLPPFLEPYNDLPRAHRGGAGDAAVRCRRGVARARAPHQTLDVWAPADSKIRLPIVFGIHGGGWEFGYPEWAGFPARQICAKPPGPYVTPAYTLGGGGERQAAGGARRFAARAAMGHRPRRAGGRRPDASHPHRAQRRWPLRRHPRPRPAAVGEGHGPSVREGALPRELPRWAAPRTLRRSAGCGVPFRAAADQAAVQQGDQPQPGHHRRHSARPGARGGSFAAAQHASRGAGGATSACARDVRRRQDSPFCKPQARRLQVEAARPGEEGPRVEVLELPEASHFDTHFELADGASEWHAALRRVLADE